MLNPYVTELLTAPGGLAPRLRALREAAGMAGKDVAALNGWHPSKVSRLENGKQVPSEADLLAWVATTQAPAAVADELAAMLRDVEASSETWKERLTGGVAGVLREVIRHVERATVIRHFDTAVVPGLAQTGEYAEAVFREVVDVHRPGGDEELADLVSLRLAPQRFLYEPPHRFELLVTENVLTRRPAALAAADMREQLRRLRDVAGAPRVRFGVIPATEPFTVAPMHTFALYDDVARVETLADWATYTGDIAADLAKDCDRLWDEAAEGDDALRIIEAAAARHGPA